MKNRGQQAEDLAAAFLQRQGLTIVERNFRVRGGEIDLVARQGSTLVFVEVRLRSRADFGGAAASITAQKQARLIRAAEHYLLRFTRLPPCRFDALLMTELDGERIEWLRDAFRP